MKTLLAAAVELDPENEETFPAWALVTHYIGHFTEVNGTCSDFVLAAIEVAADHPREFAHKARQFMENTMRKNLHSEPDSPC